MNYEVAFWVALFFCFALYTLGLISSSAYFRRVGGDWTDERLWILFSAIWPLTMVYLICQIVVIAFRGELDSED